VQCVLDGFGGMAKHVEQAPIPAMVSGVVLMLCSIGST
jgi:hypothetical protein